MISNGAASPEHEFEAAPGLPEPLPAGERVCWQGAPDGWVLARDVLHLRALALYFALLLLWRGATVAADGGSAGDAAQAALGLVPLPLLALALLATMAWLMARTTVYTVTDRRVVLRIGVVLNITFNLPLARIDSAGVRARADGSGDISLLLTEPDHIAFVHLWPHARPWRLRRTQPTLRALADVHAPAAVLASVLAASLQRAAVAAAVDDAGTPPRLRAVRREPLAA